MDRLTKVASIRRLYKLANAARLIKRARLIKSAAPAPKPAQPREGAFDRPGIDYNPDWKKYDKPGAVWEYDPDEVRHLQRKSSFRFLGPSKEPNLRSYPVKPGGYILRDSVGSAPAPAPVVAPAPVPAPAVNNPPVEQQSDKSAFPLRISPRVLGEQAGKILFGK